MKRTAILGAGLSGLTAAINLAKEGYRVDICEKNEDVGMRFHGDIQGLENWSEKKDVLEELKEMNIEINFECDPFSKLILTNCSKIKEINSKRPLFYLVKRGSFSGTIDSGLKVQALKLGVNLHFQKTVSRNEVDIVATGPIPEEVPGIVKGIVFKTNVADAAIVVFNDKLAFKGYSYLLTTRKYGCMSTVVLNEVCRVNECFEETKEFFVKKLNLDIGSFKEVGGVGGFSLKNVKKETALCVGEAAGLQDFLWGFGMRFAIKSGYLAAQSIIRNKDYEKIAKQHFRNKLKAGVVNRYLWENVLSKKDYSILINTAEFAKKNLYSMYNYNLLQRMIYPLASLSLKKTYPKLKL
jgi:flavin-dependent dehydrogenase